MRHRVISVPLYVSVCVSLCKETGKWILCCTSCASCLCTRVCVCACVCVRRPTDPAVKEDVHVVQI